MIGVTEVARIYRVSPRHVVRMVQTSPPCLVEEIAGRPEWPSVKALDSWMARRSAWVEQPHNRRQYPLVYFVQREDGEGPIKIGKTTNLDQRIAALENGCGARLNVLASHRGGLGTERALHCQFSHLRTFGEWFTPAPELLAFIHYLRFGHEFWPDYVAAWWICPNGREARPDHYRDLVLLWDRPMLARMRA